MAINQFVSSFLKGLLLPVAIVWFALTSLVMAEQLTEGVHRIDAVNVSTNSVELSLPAESDNAFTMSLSYDAKIWLLNGEQGALNNLRSGDIVSTVINADKSQLVNLSVIDREER